MFSWIDFLPGYYSRALWRATAHGNSRWMLRFFGFLVPFKKPAHPQQAASNRSQRKRGQAQAGENVSHFFMRNEPQRIKKSADSNNAHGHQSKTPRNFAWGVNDNPKTRHQHQPGHHQGHKRPPCDLKGKPAGLNTKRFQSGHHRTETQGEPINHDTAHQTIGVLLTRHVFPKHIPVKGTQAVWPMTGFRPRRLALRLLRQATARRQSRDRRRVSPATRRAGWCRSLVSTKKAMIE